MYDSEDFVCAQNSQRASSLSQICDLCNTFPQEVEKDIQANDENV